MINKKSAWIDKANTHINIVDLLTTIGVFVPDSVRNGGNKKMHCPFGFYHSDGGLSKTMRIYPGSNSVYCFSCSKRYSPVALAAAKWDTTWIAASMRLLEDAGFKPKTLTERWVEATTPVENKPDLIALADALKMYCTGLDSSWDSRQYDDIVANKLTQCLGLLDLVQSDEDAVRWLTACKLAMTKVLEAQ